MLTLMQMLALLLISMFMLILLLLPMLCCVTLRRATLSSATGLDAAPVQTGPRHGGRLGAQRHEAGPT